MAQVRAGVVLADVFRHDAAAGGTLAFVLAVIARFPTVGDFEERIARNKPRTNEFHQLCVVRKAPHDEAIIDATVVLDAEAFKVFDLPARCGLDVPPLRQLADASGDLLHLARLKLPRLDSATLQIRCDLLVRSNVDEAEHKTRDGVSKTITQPLDFLKKFGDGQ